MVTFPNADFTMKFFINNTNTEFVDDQNFISFTVDENIPGIIPSIQLVLMYDTGNIIHFDTGEPIKITLETVIKEGQSSTNDTNLFTLDYVVGASVLDQGSVKIHLYSKLSIIMLKDEITKGYRGQVEDVIGDVVKAVGITNTDIGTTKLASRVFLQCNQTYTQFLRYLTRYAQSQRADFFLSVNKTGKLTFRSYADLLGVDPKVTYVSTDFSQWRFDVNKFFMGLDGGYGRRYAAFDWSTGQMNTGKYDMSRLNGQGYGIRKDYADSGTYKIMMLNTYTDESGTNNFLPPNNYNQALLENYIIRKNAFNVSLTAVMKGNFWLSPLDKVETNHIWYDQTLNDRYIANDYLIFRAKHMFTKSGYYTELTMFSKSYLPNTKPPQSLFYI